LSPPQKGHVTTEAQRSQRQILYRVLKRWFPVLGSQFLVLDSWLSVFNNKVLSPVGIKGALQSALMDCILKSAIVIFAF
jgi:hypothetical protein